jgi:hypothetical protein
MFVTNSALNPGACVQVEVANHLLLGVVVYSREAGGEFDIGIRLEHSLDLSALRGLARAAGAE